MGASIARKGTPHDLRLGRRQDALRVNRNDLQWALIAEAGSIATSEPLSHFDTLQSGLEQNHCDQTQIVDQQLRPVSWSCASVLPSPHCADCDGARQREFLNGHAQVEQRADAGAVGCSLQQPPEVR